MRSSIACVRCRRSKVKCVNDGVNTTCKGCDASGRPCQYPDPIACSRKRQSSLSVPSLIASSSESEIRRQRPRRSLAGLPGELPLPGGQAHDGISDALNSSLLTPVVWQELYEIFQLHFSADLPFLHRPTFLKPLHQANAQAMQYHLLTAEPQRTSRPPGSEELLLAFLALTARFHPKLVAHHSPPGPGHPSNPLAASEYYGTAARARLAGSLGQRLGEYDLERIQAMLMLALHEWGMCRGAKAWIYVGVAIRSAQAVGLQYEHDLDDDPWSLSRSLALSSEVQEIGVKRSRLGHNDDGFVEQEVRRRTFWSCFIMDRYLSSGKYRPQALHAKELRLQLPASDQAFLFGQNVRTLLLDEEREDVAGRAEVYGQTQTSARPRTQSEDETCARQSSHTTSRNSPQRQEEYVKWELGADEGLISRYIRILEIYGKVVRWSCAGGRRRERFPPWDTRCGWYNLRKAVSDFKADLPRNNTLTPQNTSAHIHLRTSTPYTLVHTVYSLCQIILHREYIPFIPLRCSKPEGPLDPPLLSPLECGVPPGFWEQSASECFSAARDIINLVRSCQEWSALVETPIIGFALYTVAFVGIYCINFPWMDPDGYMCPKSSQTKSSPSQQAFQDDSNGEEAASKALELIGQMRPRLRMADGWFRTIKRMHRYYGRIITDYRFNTRNLVSEDEHLHASTRHLTLREGGPGGGLEEYKLLEKTLNEFGNLDDEDPEPADISMTEEGDLPEYGIPEHIRPAVKNELGIPRPNQPPPSTSETARQDERWNAINHAAATSLPLSQAAPPHPTQNPSPTHLFSINQTGGSGPGLFRSFSAYTYPTSTTHPYADPRPTSSIPPLLSPAGATTSTPSHASPPSRGSALPGLHYASPSTQHPSPCLPPPPLPAPATAVPQTPWDVPTKDAWLNSLETRLGGDDIAAFVDGGEWHDWAGLAARKGFGGGWLSAVWRAGGGAPAP